MPGQSPYVGLEAFTEEDAEFFFGREREEEIVEANLYAARLSILYGATGVGKSSVLRGGVVPRLVEADQAIVVIFRDWQGDGYAAALKQACLDAAGVAGDAGQSLDDLLVAITEEVRRPVFVLLDQFEEYLNRARTDRETSFEEELARAVNRAEVEASFLIALREDAISGLDRFGPRIPRLLTNRIRLHHLDQKGAYRAVREPLRVWRERTGETAKIEDELVDALLDDVRAGSAEWLLAARERQRQPQPRSGSDGAVEAPLLQLVLEQLWLHGETNGGHELRMESYSALGRAPGVARHHFEDVLERMSSRQRELCSRFFDRLVTPSEGKIAYRIEDLELEAGELSPEVKPTVDALAEARILRRVDLPDYAGVELYHDVLAPAVLEWRRRLDEGRRREEERRRRRRRALQVSALLGTVLVVALLLLGYRWYTEFVAERPWATLTNLATGETSELAGNQAIVGRETPEIDVQVSFPTRLVSRLHLLVLRDGRRAMDVRSLNGTTVNGEFIPYGQSRRLRAGDIVVVAGVAALRFEPLHYRRLQFWVDADDQPPARGWALLVDGPTRAVTPLVARRSYLARRNGRLAVLESRPSDAIAQVGQSEGEPYLIPLPGARLAATFQDVDRQTGHAIPRREALVEGRAYLVGSVFVTDGLRFQVVPTRPR